MKNSYSFVRTLFILAVMSIMPRLASAGTDIWSGSGGSLNQFWLSTANWQAGTLPQVGDQLVFTNAVSLVNSNNYPSATIFGGITFATPAGGFVLNGSSVTLTNNITDQQVVTPQNINLPLIVNSPLNLNVNVTANGILNLNNVISGSGGLTNSGGGTLNLIGNNTFAGPLVINGGTVTVAGETNLPAAPTTPAAGNIVLNGGTLNTLVGFAINTNHGIVVGSPTVSGGSGTIQTTTNTTAVFPVVSYGGVIADNAGGAGGLAKLGFGGLTLFGQNTYTGTTSNQVGLLTLDFSQPTAPTANIINSASPLVFGGANAGVGVTNYAKLSIVGKASTANSQTFNGTHVTIGSAAILVNSGASGSANLALGALDHDAGGVLTLVPPTITGGSGNITTTSGNNNGILGGWATIGGGTTAQGWTVATNWACNDGSGNIVNYTGFTVYNNPNALLKASGGAANNIYVSVTAAFTNDLNGATSTNDVNSLFFDNTGTAPVNYTFFVGSNNVIRLGQFGGIFKRDITGGFSWNFGGTNISTTVFTNASGLVESYVQAASGAITAGGPTYGTPGEVVLIATSTGSGSGNNLNIDSQIMDNGPGGTVTLIKAGQGYITIRNHNTYSGGTYILGGRLAMTGNNVGNNNSDGLGTGPITVFPGGNLFYSAALTITNDQYISGTGSPEEPGVGAIRAAGGTNYGIIRLIGDSEIGGGGGTIAGPISGPFNLTLLEASTAGGALTLTSTNNSWSGNTTIVAEGKANSGGQTLFNGANEIIPNGFGKGNVTMQGFTSSGVLWDLHGFNETINGLSTTAVSANGTNCIITNGVASTTSTLTVGDNNASGIFGGLIQGGAGVLTITKIGGGVETFTNINTYTGATTISNGVLQLTGIGSISNSANVYIDGGTFDVSSLSYSVPSGQTISMSGGTLFVSSATSGTTPVNFTNGTLEVTALNVGSANLNAQTVNLGASTINYIQPANIPLIDTYPKVYPIIHYNTALNANGSGFTAQLPAGGFPPYGGYVTNDTGAQNITLVLTNGPITPSLTWVGFSGGALNSAWDFIASDWTNKPAHIAASYSEGSLANFDDSGRTNVVNLTATFAPAGVTVTNSNTYTFVGAGGIGGTNGVTKLGVGTLILDNTGSNTFSGGLTIGAGGTVQVGNFDTAGSVGSGAITAGGSLIFKRTDNPSVPNSISGSGAIQQLGTNSTLVLGGNNGAFSGTMFATNNGTLQGGSGSTTALGATNSVVNVASGSTVDANGRNLGGAQIYISGIGVTNSDGTTNGAIINSSAAGIFPAVARVTMLGDTVFGAPTEGVLANSSVLSNRWDLRSPTTSDANGASLTGNGHNLIKVSMNQVGIVGATVDSTLANIDVQNGILSIEAATTGLGDPSKTLTVENGATLSIYQATNQFNKNIVLNGSGINTFNSSSSLGTVNSQSGNNTIGGPVTVNGDVQITFRNSAGTATGGALVISNLVTGMSGSGSLTKNDTNTLTVGGLDTHSGGTIVNDGTFILNGMSTAAANSLTINTHTLAVATTLGGNGTNKGPVVVNDTMWPGVGGKPSSFGAGNGTVSPSFQFVPGASVVFNLGSTTTAGGGVNDLINVAGDFDAGGANVQINPVGVLTTGVPYTLVNYTGSMLSSSFNQNVNVVPAAQPSRYVFSVSYPAHQVQLTVTTGAGLLEWNGASGDGLWNVQNSQNWTNTATSTPQSPKDYQFLQGDQVLLDDSIIASGGTNVLTITTNNPVQPASFTVNSTTNYTIQGPGSIAGTLNITKGGSSTLRIDTANTFSGTVTITNGSLLVNNTAALGSASTVVVVTNGGTLDVGGPSFAAGVNPLINSNQPVFISGFGVNGKGAIINSSANQQEYAFENLTLTGDAGIGGDSPGRWDMGRQAIGSGSLSTGGHPYNLSKVGTNYVALLGVAIDPSLANVDIQGGILGFQQGITNIGNPSGTLTVEAGSTLELYNSTTNLQTITKQFVLHGDGVTGTITNESGATTLNGSMTLNGNCLIGGGGAVLTNNGVMIGSGGLTKVAGGALILTTAETYTGNTTINGGTLTLLGSASLNSSTNITLRSGATLDVSGHADGALTPNGQTLSANGGTINGSLTNIVGAISLAGTNGTFAVTNNATLGGTFTNRLDQGSNVVFSVGGNLVYGGTLVVTTNAASTTPLTAGTSYKLFKAAAYNNGTFSSVTLPGLPAGLSWTNGLAVDGTIGVVSTVTTIIPTVPATIQGFALSGTNVLISGTNAVNGGTYYLLSSANMALPLSQWTPVMTNVVNTNGATGNGFSVTGTNVVVPADQQQFYILSNTN